MTRYDINYYASITGKFVYKYGQGVDTLSEADCKFIASTVMGLIERYGIRELGKNSPKFLEAKGQELYDDLLLYLLLCGVDDDGFVTILEAKTVINEVRDLINAQVQEFIR